ncbi:hypothetical protein [Candidatus Amarolinea dominans]|nr:hypothetical protein [Anaerolineae bacterium]
MFDLLGQGAVGLGAVAARGKGQGAAAGGGDFAGSMLLGMTFFEDG